ncbi:hypothetical protein [Bacillus sp. EB01]|nr:hypothetical protein [Bacillus sp. EB01]
MLEGLIEKLLFQPTKNINKILSESRDFAKFIMMPHKKMNAAF